MYVYLFKFSFSLSFYFVEFVVDQSSKMYTHKFKYKRLRFALYTRMGINVSLLFNANFRARKTRFLRN